MIWLFDPLHRLPPRWKLAGYMYLTQYFARLTIWHTIDNKWGRP